MDKVINKNFAFLWIGKLISQLGDNFYGIALSWWILQKTNSPSTMGLFLLISVLPGIIFGLFAGALTDRWKRKSMLIITDLIRGGLILVISYLSMISALEIWHVFVIGFGLSLAASFFDPAIQAIIPDIVEGEKLTKANGMSQMVNGACTVTGPLLGGLAVSTFGMTNVFLANGISYLISACLAGFIKTNNSFVTLSEKKNIREDILEGIAFIKGQKDIVIIMKIIAIGHFFIGSQAVLLPFLAKQLQGNGVTNLGYLQMMLGVGLIVGSVIAGLKKTSSIHLDRMLLYIIGVGVCFSILGITQISGVRAIYIYMLVIMVMGGCIANASVYWQSLLQSNTPANLTGRVFGLSTLVADISLPLAYGSFGMLLEFSTTGVLLIICGICLLSYTILLMLLQGLKMHKEERDSESAH